MNNILHGSADDKLKELEADSVDCCITSPPYWGLRDYKTPGQLGLEPTFQEYIKKLVDIFSQVRRVLKKSGACWVNLGDTYAGTGDKKGRSEGQGLDVIASGRTQDTYNNKKVEGVSNKSLCLIPERFAIAMVDEGWILRNKIIWFKPNCMPSSAKDRFTVDWEYLFFFTKSQRYYFETQYEPHIKTPEEYASRRQYGYHYEEMETLGVDVVKGGHDKHFINPQNPLGRIKRCVWKIATQPFSEAHFATFPPALVKTPLLATCPEYICKRCDKAREKIIESQLYATRPGNVAKYEDKSRFNTNHNHLYDNLKYRYMANRKEAGLTDCGCNAGFDGGLVLDPFAGAGTVPLVALQNARNFIGIELNQSYIDMALKRLEPYLLQTRLQIG